VLRSIQAAQATWAEQTAVGLEPDHLDELREALAAIHDRLTEGK